MGLMLKTLLIIVFTSTMVSARQMSREAAGLVQGGRPVSRAEKIRDILGRQEGIVTKYEQIIKPALYGG